MIMRRLEVVIKFFETHLTRENGWLLLLVVLLFGGAVAYLVGGWFKGIFIKVAFSPFWPFVMFVFEMWRQRIDKKTATNNEKIIEKLKAVLNDGRESHEPDYLLAIIESRDTEISVARVDAYIDRRIAEDNPIQ